MSENGRNAIFRFSKQAINLQVEWACKNVLGFGSVLIEKQIMKSCHFQFVGNDGKPFRNGI